MVKLNEEIVKQIITIVYESFGKCQPLKLVSFTRNGSNDIKIIDNCVK
jgi:hypothetical protein